jgi:hypothetical protein
MPSSPEINDALALIAQARSLLDDAEARLTGQPVQRTATKGLPAPADDADLDGQYGNPVVHKDPPKWTGQTYAGAPFSDCPPDYLRILADLLVWRAGKADEEGRTTKGGKPQSEFLRKDAARALGWMQRNERKAAPRPKAKPTSLNDPDDSEVPF